MSSFAGGKPVEADVRRDAECSRLSDECRGDLVEEEVLGAREGREGQTQAREDRRLPQPIVESDLANRRDNVPERFIPELMRGETMEAEHLGRYHWAEGFASDRRVPDAGCGAGYGSAMLAEAGARSVVGVDIAAAVLEAARPRCRTGYCSRRADLRALEHEVG